MYHQSFQTLRCLYTCISTFSKIGSRPIVLLNISHNQKQILMGMNWYGTESKQRDSGKEKRMKKTANFDYSGDLTTKEILPNSEIVHKYKKISDLDSLPDHIKKLCTLQYASGIEYKEHLINEMRDKIRHLFGERAFREQSIAKLTIDIRNLIGHCVSNSKDKLNKSTLIEKIQQRRKYLKFLRREDYQRFEWLLEELKIQYIPVPKYQFSESNKLKRKSAVKAEAYAVRQKKIDELKAKLEEEKREFFAYKDSVMREINKDIETYNLDKQFLQKHLYREDERRISPYVKKCRKLATSQQK